MDKSQAKLLGLGGTAAAAFYLQRKYGRALVTDVKNIRLEQITKKRLANVFKQGLMFVDLFLKNVEKHTYKPCILFQNSIYTYGDVDAESNKVANFAKGTGYLEQKETVAFFMKNEPAFCWWFIAMQKIGVTCGFINNNIRGKALLHCIKLLRSKILVSGGEPDLIEAVLEILPELKQLNIRVWLKGHQLRTFPNDICLIEDPVQSSSVSSIPRCYRSQITYEDQSHYVFTSGTTGLPKACKNYNTSSVLSAVVVPIIFGFHQDDIVYTSLPLYHSSAFGLTFLGCMGMGCTLAISPKFSAANFWNDVRKHHATVVHYIGEICRYLLSQPKKPDDGVYPVNLRTAFGNGLRSDIWETFKNRFNIENILEFYAATEGTHIYINFEGKVGSVGRITPIMKMRGQCPLLVKCNIETCKPIRGKDGNCIVLPQGETGLLVTVIDEQHPFRGYLNNEATEKKILRNVLTKGDMYFNSGDLLKIDRNGYLYFVDRLGDTFRWKGENVSTSEVAGILHEFLGIIDANVYGVEIPGQDGKAGMAAVTLDADVKSFDFKKLYTYLCRSLPSYARPKFIRIVKNMDLTSTYKHRKTEFAKQGFDPMLITDKLYYLNKDSKTYEVLNTDSYESVLQISSRL